MSFTRYVLMVVVDPMARTAVGLIKKKGPTFLHGKMSFPGGKLEEGEGPHEAATREMREETGLNIPLAAWLSVDIQGDESYELYVLAAESAAVHEARTLETEKVLILDIDEHLKRARKYGSEYAPDFIPLLIKAITALGLASELCAA